MKPILKSKRRGRRLPDGTDLLGHINVCNVKVSIVRASVTQALCLRDDDGSTLLGRFVESPALIVVRRGLSDAVERDTIVHECIHALLAYSGAKQFLTGPAKEISDGDELEETLVRILAPHVAALRWES